MSDLPELGKKFKFKDVEGYCRIITSPDSDNPIYMIVGDDDIINISKKTIESVEHERDAL